MSVWEFEACLDGWAEANAPADDAAKLEPPTPEQFWRAVTMH